MSTERGRRAEEVAAQHLRNLGYRIMAQNWRTRWCEIDIIAQKKNIVYFVEVKYRLSDIFGSGLDYITPRKLAQMQFAAEFWLAANLQTTDAYRVAAIEVMGKEYEVTAWLDDVL